MTTWAGSWVGEHLGVRLETTAAPVGLELEDLVGLALRRNPRRAHLLVSTVLGKHIPTDPEVVHDAGIRLGGLVAERLDGRSKAVVLGYAETATGLGHLVAEALDAPVLHSTRRPVPGVTPIGGFEEEHSHATSHLLLPEDQRFLDGPGPLVLVDDELSTGTTILNTIATLHAAFPREQYVVATLVDLRSEADRTRMAQVADTLGVRLDVVALAAGRIQLPDDVLERGQALVAAARPAPLPRTGTARVERVALPAGAPREGGRHGFTVADRAALVDYLSRIELDVTGRVHVLGFEELMYAPLLLARALATAHPDASITYSTTTRTPVLPVDEDGYAIRSALAFPAHDDPADGPGTRYAYNLTAGDPFDAIVLVVDEPGDTPALRDGLLAQLGAAADRVLLVTLPARRPVPAPLPTPLRGPAFGSYAADDVTWLLKDLSAVELEAPVEEREEAIQAGGAHYAESLPVEYQPSADYQRLFAQALETSAERVAHAVGLVTEQVLRLRDHRPVLVSLARAGTPVGVLMRRWAQVRHGIDLPHYAISIIRGRGIDLTALRYLAAHHDPADVMFVDGWTGKGAITRELEASVREANTILGTSFPTELAVLADTGRCCEIFGTRDDFLIPSACLNSTVSGLISRTVLNTAYVAPSDFHGAKFYAELSDADVSQGFIDAVAAHFDHITPVAETGDTTPTWAGWAAVEEIGSRYGIDDPNLIKPGVGETTRVLLRRVPWRILVRPDAATELAHVRLLAEQRGVELVEVEDLPYSCVGLIHPKFTRGATGRDGTAATVTS